MHISQELNNSAIRAITMMAVCLILPTVVAAQSATDSSLYVKAQQMVTNGDAANGRKLADSIAAAAPAGSAAFAEGLFWRATLAANARDSEHEYREIIVDYPLSGRVPDALLRIGQLESARGENAAALQHFQRLVLEHPMSPLRAEASYWVARMYFDGNDATRACAANADALTSVKSSNVELKNRIDFQQQRCRGVALATNTPMPAASAPAAPPAHAPPRAPVSASKSTSQPQPQPRAERHDTDMKTAQRPESTIASSASSAIGANSGVVSRQPTREEVDRAMASAELPISSKASRAKRSSTASSTSPATPKRVAIHDSSAPSVTSSARRSGGSFAIQVAAFGTKGAANQLAAKLRGRGYNTYVDGTSAPYRVRIGHYPTHSTATAELAKLKATHIDGFVVER